MISFDHHEFRAGTRIKVLELDHSALFIIQVKFKPLALQLDVNAAFLLCAEYFLTSIPAAYNTCLIHLKMVSLDACLDGLTQLNSKFGCSLHNCSGSTMAALILNRIIDPKSMGSKCLPSLVCFSFSYIVILYLSSISQTQLTSTLCSLDDA